MECAISTRVKAMIVPEKEPPTHLMVEPTPPLRILSLCSVNKINFASGYSRGEFGCSGFEGNGVEKKFRPACDYGSVSDKLKNRLICKARPR